MVSVRPSPLPRSKYLILSENCDRYWRDCGGSLMTYMSYVIIFLQVLSPSSCYQRCNLESNETKILIETHKWIEGHCDCSPHCLLDYSDFPKCCQDYVQLCHFKATKQIGWQISELIMQHPVQLTSIVVGILIVIILTIFIVQR